MIYDCSSVQSCDSASCSYFHTLTFFQPPIFPKTLTNLTDLTDFTILQTPYRQCAGTFRTFVQLCRLHGAPDIFSCTLHRLLHRCVPPGLEIVRRAVGRALGRQLHVRAGMQELHVFYRFCLEKLKFLGQKKSPKICSPTRHRVQISFMAWNRVKWQEKSGAPRRRVPASHSPKCRNRMCR